jgi:hypothetical protein
MKTKYIFNYGSIEQSATGSDIEEIGFEDYWKMMTYINRRVDKEKNVVYIFMIEQSSWTSEQIYEYPTALVTRIFGNIDWADVPGRFFLFEVDCYEEAFNYLKDCFETSSMMYPKKKRRGK